MIILKWKIEPKPNQTRVFENRVSLEAKVSKTKEEIAEDLKFVFVSILFIMENFKHNQKSELVKTHVLITQLQ